MSKQHFGYTRLNFLWDSPFLFLPFHIVLDNLTGIHYFVNHEIRVWNTIARPNTSNGCFTAQSFPRRLISSFIEATSEFLLDILGVIVKVD